MAARSRRPEAGRWPALSPLALALTLVAGNSVAQTTVVSPRLDASLMWTDNAGSSGIGGFGGSGGSDRRGEDWILELSPSISVARDSGRLNGTFTATLRNLMYASSADRNTTYLALTGAGEYEAIEKMLFIDADASISRSNLSAFSTRASGDNLDVNPDNETRMFSLSPRFQFRIGDNTEGVARYRWRWMDSGNTTLANQNQSDWSLQLTNTRVTGIFGLGLSYNRSSSSYGSASGLPGGGGGSSSFSGGGKEQEILRATLYAKVTPDFRLRGIVGRESNDYGSQGKQSNTVTGGGFDWNPTDRTAISGTVENRIFGRGYDFSLQHRMARTTFFLTFGRDIQSSFDMLAGGGLVDPLYLPLFNDPLLVALYPDPIVRRDVVLLLLRQLRGDVLTNAFFVNRSFNGGVTYSLPRGVVSFSFSRTDRSRLGNGGDLAPTDDFRNFSDVKSTGATLSYSHRLTRSASLNTSITRSKSKGSGATAADTQRTSFNIGISSSLGPMTTGSLQYRHQRSDGDSFGSGSNDFSENAVTATVGMRF